MVGLCGLCVLCAFASNRVCDVEKRGNKARMSMKTKERSRINHSSLTKEGNRRAGMPSSDEDGLGRGGTLHDRQGTGLGKKMFFRGNELSYLLEIQDLAF